jgi:hypothetical protein
MSADDFQTFPTDAPQHRESPDSPYTPGNRPASGARRATPGEVLSRGFSGAENAGDFLGLDEEFAGSQGPAAVQGESGLELEPAPGTYKGGPVANAEPPPYGPASYDEPHVGPQPSAFEFGQDLGSEEHELTPEPRRRRALPVFAAMALVGVLGAGGFLYGPELYTRFGGKKEDVASQLRTPRPRPPAATPDSGGEAAAADPAQARVAVGGAEVGMPLASTASVEQGGTGTEPPLASGSAFDPATGAEESALEPTSAFEPVANDGPGAETPDAGAQGDLLAGLLGTPATGSLDPGQPVPFPDLGDENYAWASEDQLELIWRGSSVPMEAVFAPARTLMPRVGNVRIFTDSGDVFEGRLYAVGQERVWIDGAPGRIGLDGKRVERIEVLPLEGDLSKGAEPPAKGKRVRVRVPGGMLYGHVLKIEGEEVILALDDGGKVRVQSARVENLGPGRAVVVHR